MYEADKTNKYSADKIVLLAMFALALLTARLVIFLKSSVALTEPLPLRYTGLAVSIPKGRGWQSEKQWVFQDNTFTLSSVFKPASNSIAAIARCRYRFVAPGNSIKQQFAEKASQTGGTIHKTGKTQRSPITVQWAHIRNRETWFDTCFGIASLPDGRQLEIEVHQAIGDSRLTQRVFNKINESLQFKDNHLLQAGNKIVAKIKSKGLKHFITNQDQQTFFLVKNDANENLGFAMSLTTLDNHNAKSIRSADYVYVRSKQTSEQVSIFESDNRLQQFTWKSELSNITGKSGAEISLNADGIMTVRRFSPQPKKKSYPLGPAAIPKTCLPTLLEQLIEGGKEEVLTDLIEANGTITPTKITLLQPPKTTESRAAYTFKIEFSNPPGFTETIYLDGQKQLYKRRLEQENIYTVQRTTIGAILNAFPERADYIIQQNKMLQ